MTPEEKAVIEAAMDAHQIGSAPTRAQENILRTAVHLLIFSCPQCNAGGHVCPGDGKSIGHTQTSCGQHSADPLPGESEPPVHAGADGSCPDYGGTLDPCPPGCASGTCVAGALGKVKESYRTEVLKQEWTPATFALCLAGDRIRIGQDETDVITHSLGEWHADTSDPYQPKRWDHVELLMDLSANPGKRNYPPNTPCEILTTPERKAVLTMQSAFPGSAVTSSDVD